MKREAFVVGAGPNGLTAAILLARAGVPTTLLESDATVGGGTRSVALTLPGFVHDVCSAVHPMALTSPVWRTFPLSEYGVEWIQPPVLAAHPFDDGTAAAMWRSMEETALRLGPDARIYRRAFRPMVKRWDTLAEEILGPLHVSAHPLLLARFGALGGWPAGMIARAVFRTREARALFAGMAAHSCLPLERFGSAAFGWVLQTAGHAVGWPIARGGSQTIANALASYFESLGGRIVTNTVVKSLDEFPREATVLLNLTPRQVLRIAGDRMPVSYNRRLERYRYGPGVFKLDWALDRPIPWRSGECGQAGTVHLGGPMEEIEESERAPWNGVSHPRPFVLLVQPSLFDATRAPAGKHTGWAYCHVPNGSTEDMTQAIENQVERFAPGFRSTILSRCARNTADMERYDANLVGGDINGGAQDMGQLFLRPNAHLYRTPLKRVFLCSSSTPPGGAVHGMCGYHAARLALRALE